MINPSEQDIVSFLRRDPLFRVGAELDRYERKREYVLTNARRSELILKAMNLPRGNRAVEGLVIGQQVELLSEGAGKPVKYLGKSFDDIGVGALVPVCNFIYTGNNGKQQYVEVTLNSLVRVASPNIVSLQMQDAGIKHSKNIVSLAIIHSPRTWNYSRTQANF